MISENTARELIREARREWLVVWGTADEGGEEARASDIARQEELTGEEDEAREHFRRELMRMAERGTPITAHEAEELLAEEWPVTSG